MKPSGILPIRSTADACTDLLRREILTGRYNDNSFIIDRVAQRLGVSHTPVREAVRRLEAEGFLRYEPRKGVKVRPLNLDEFEELIALRKALEPIVLKQSIEVSDHAVFDIAAARLKMWVEASGSSEILDAQWEFFRVMYEVSCLVRIMEIIETNWYFIERFHRHSWDDSDKAKKMDFEHKKQILDSFSKRDGEGAIAALKRSIDWDASLVRNKLSASKLAL